MIFVPPKYVFIVGGTGNKTVELYNTETYALTEDSTLNFDRSECSLCLVNNAYLYAFYGFLLHHTFVDSIERCNLLRGKREWDTVNLKVGSDLSPSQSFFSTFLMDEDKVILFGEPETVDEKENDEEKVQNFMLTCNESENEHTLETYNGLSTKINCIYREKFFIPINSDSAALIPLVVNDVKVLILKNEEGTDLTVYEPSGQMNEDYQ